MRRRERDGLFHIHWRLCDERRALRRLHLRGRFRVAQKMTADRDQLAIFREARAQDRFVERHRIHLLLPHDAPHSIVRRHILARDPRALQRIRAVPEQRRIFPDEAPHRLVKIAVRRIRHRCGRREETPRRHDVIRRAGDGIELNIRTRHASAKFRERRLPLRRECRADRFATVEIAGLFAALFLRIIFHGAGSGRGRRVIGCRGGLGSRACRRFA